MMDNRGGGGGVLDCWGREGGRTRGVRERGDRWGGPGERGGR